MHIEYDPLDLIYLFECEPNFDDDNVRINYSKTIDNITLKFQIVTDLDLVSYNLTDKNLEFPVATYYVYNVKKMERENEQLCISTEDGNELYIQFDGSFSFLNDIQ